MGVTIGVGAGACLLGTSVGKGETVGAVVVGAGFGVSTAGEVAASVAISAVAVAVAVAVVSRGELSAKAGAAEKIRLEVQP